MQGSDIPLAFRSRRAPRPPSSALGQTRRCSLRQPPEVAEPGLYRPKRVPHARVTSDPQHEWESATEPAITDLFVVAVLIEANNKASVGRDALHRRAVPLPIARPYCLTPSAKRPGRRSLPRKGSSVLGLPYLLRDVRWQDGGNARQPQVHHRSLDCARSGAR